MRSRVEGTVLADNILLRGNRIGGTLLASTGTTIVLGADITDLVELRLTGAAGVRLPAASAALKYRKITFLNSSTGATAATIKTSTGGALVPATSIQKGKIKSVICNGSNWYGEGNAST